MAGLRFGLTLSRPTEDVGQLLWSAGINQNAVLLARLLQRLQGTGSVAMVDCSGLPAPHPLAQWAGFPTLQPQEAVEALDVLIEIGGRADGHLMRRLRERGGKLVSYMAGNAMVMNFEAVASGLPHGEMMSQEPFDAVWITPQHWRMNRDLCRITRSEKTRLVPHIWEPVFFDLFAQVHAIDPFFKTAATSPSWRLAVLEPNINVLKTFHLPLLVAEQAYRHQPNAIGEVLLFNTRHLVGDGHFDDFTTSLDLFADGKLFAEERLATPTILARHADAVVVHQWENDLNYLYWEVLWSGHPLIHNSPTASPVGYHYRDFDPIDGGRVLMDALARHRDRASEARREAIAFVGRFSISHPAVIAAHVTLIEELLEC